MKIVGVVLLAIMISLIFIPISCGENDMNNSATDNPLIPRKVLFDNPDKSSVRLSFDGKWLSYLAPLKGVLNVWVAPIDNLALARPVTNDTYRGIRSYGWSYTSDYLYYVQDLNGDENWRIYSVDIMNGKIIDLTPINGTQAQIIRASLIYKDKLLVGLNDANPSYHRLYLIDIITGNRTLVMDNDEYAGFRADEELVPRIAFKMTAEGGYEYLIRSKNETWKPYFNVSTEDALTTSVLLFDRTGKTLYLTDCRNRDTSSLVAVDMETGNQTVLAKDDKADLIDLIIDNANMTIQAAGFEYDRIHWQIIDQSIAKDIEYLNNVTDGELSVISRTLDDDLWVAAYVMDDGPVKYYLYNRTIGNATFLFTNRENLEGQPLVKMHPAIIKSRDGLDLVCYYSLPRDSGDGLIPDHPVPMVLTVHGGPWGRDSFGYSSWHQWLANRGYAVMSVNFRGSVGFGKNFTNAGNLEWGRKMHDDLLDSVNWAVDSGIADPSKVAIMGASYGGYAALIGITMTPDVFACGVDMVGPSNLVTLLETIPPYWKPEYEMFTSRVGDNRTEEGRTFLLERSPISYVDNITKPLLIAQGANDPRVKKSESDQIVQAMENKRIPVTYLLYSDEGHGFARPENSLSFYAVTEAFLSSTLNGRYEPIGDDFNGSTIDVLVGAEYVPGLKEALDARNSTKSDTIAESEG